MCYIPLLGTYMVFFKDFFYLWNDRISHKNSVKWGEKYKEGNPQKQIWMKCLDKEDTR